MTFQEIEFQIPPRQRGEVTTVEGLLRTSAEKLGEAQDLRMERSPEVCDATVMWCDGVRDIGWVTFLLRFLHGVDLFARLHLVWTPKVTSQPHTRNAPPPPAEAGVSAVLSGPVLNMPAPTAPR